MTKLNTKSQNEKLAKQAEAMAAEVGLGITRYQTNKYNHDGWNAYALYTNPEQGRPYGTRSIRVVEYTTERHSKYNEPSISGEASSLRYLMNWMRNEFNEGRAKIVVAVAHL